MDDKTKEMNRVMRAWGKVLDSLRKMESPEANYVLERITADMAGLRDA